MKNSLSRPSESLHSISKADDSNEAIFFPFAVALIVNGKRGGSSQNEFKAESNSLAERPTP